MDRDEIEASRECVKIGRFLDDMVGQERMTMSEKRVVEREAEAVARAAGHLDAGGKPTGRGGDEFAAVARHENHVQKRKILELHPELEGELERFIAHRPHHPLPPVVGRLAVPGAALRQYRALIGYIDAKVEQGVITARESYQMNDPAIAVFQDSGVDSSALTERTDKAVIARAYHLMKRKLLELHPELAGDLPDPGPSRSR
jgi:hypothetical protein